MLSNINLLFKCSKVGIRYIPICNNPFRSFSSNYNAPKGKGQNVKKNYEDINIGRASTEDTNIGLDEIYKTAADLKPNRDEPLKNVNTGVDKTKSDKNKEGFSPKTTKEQLSQEASDALNEAKKKAEVSWDAAKDSAKYAAEKVSSVDRNTIRDKIRDTARDTIKDAKDTYQSAKETVSSTADKAKDKIKDTFNTSDYPNKNINDPEMATSQKLWEQAKDTAANITSEAGHIAEKVKDTIKQKIGLTDADNTNRQNYDANNNERIVDKIVHTAKDAAESAKETAKDAAAAVKETAKDAAASAKEKAKDTVESVKETARRMTGRRD